MTSGAAHAYEHKVDGIYIEGSKWYVASYTISSDVTKKFELRMQNSNGWGYIGTAQSYITEVEAGKTVKVT